MTSRTPGGTGGWPVGRGGVVSGALFCRGVGDGATGGVVTGGVEGGGGATRAGGTDGVGTGADF